MTRSKIQGDWNNLILQCFTYIIPANLSPEKMNEQQNTVLATAVSSLILVIVFLCPWRIESSNELQWSPIYQSPLTHVRTYNAQHGSQGGSKITSEEAHIAYEILALEVLGVIITGGLLYVFFADRKFVEKATLSEQS